MKQTAKYICGCGLSSTFPICDGAHAIAKLYGGALSRCGAPAELTAPSPKLLEREPVRSDSAQEVEAVIA